MTPDPPSASTPLTQDVSGVSSSRVVAEEPFTAAELALESLVAECHLARAGDLPRLVREHAALLGGHDAVIYLADLQQTVLLPFLPDGESPEGARTGTNPAALLIDSTLAGRAFQMIEVLSQELGRDASDDSPSLPTAEEASSLHSSGNQAGPEAAEESQGGLLAWLPLLDGTERLGLLAVTVHDPAHLEPASPMLRRLRRFASLVAEIIVAKTMYGDTIVRLRRTQQLNLAAEIQWSLLPPLTFGSTDVTIAAGLEPAYRVAGDSVDYAVDTGIARLAVFDGMGHGLSSAQLVNLVVNAYRHARRAGHGLTETIRRVDTAVTEIFHGETFCTGVFAELATDSGEFRWVSAGHLEPLLLRDGRLVRSLSTAPVLPLGLADGFPGIRDSADVGVEHLQPGDIVMLYTDGVTEARSPDGEFFGIDRLVDLVTRNLAAGLPAPETLRRVIRALLEHQHDALDDDASLLLVQWRGDAANRLLPEPAREGKSSLPT
jgi:hypothetical protein